ncbi:DBR1-domain-containing protein [Amniculicola lignicola CBS 123094]|uniref:DBR1-domain-containing protein n=1 Tax=Amniculicola lignicola CBS 123094 TaxID=1392246 RepID=A0A6A5WLZ3_9PLEO|nr:DBR1-domain-containing protein [Amniculicola lignicola CBS 123094]
MDSPNLFMAHTLRIAVEGCGHGTLHSIYASIKKSCEFKGWDGVDLLIICGDFQAVRNAHDLKAVAMPAKYYHMGDFHEYYSGAATAPYLTIFVGGNHESSSYMWELFYGGWAAPNIYYMGAANVIRLGSLRIAGMSGIWKGYNFRKPHFERLPYNDGDVRSIYHIRELETRKLLQIRSQVDIGISHDWPNGVEWKGNYRQLFSFKPHFEAEAKDGVLGNPATMDVLKRLRPAHWFSAHLHCKFSALWNHEDDATNSTSDENNVAIPMKQDDASADMDESNPTAAPVAKNEEEIDLDMDDDGAQPTQPEPTGTGDNHNNGHSNSTAVPKSLRDLLPESFARPAARSAQPKLPFPVEIANKTTRFLALDKCLPNRRFLQLLEVTPLTPGDEIKRPLQLEYDTEWLAITRVFSSDLKLSDPGTHVPSDKGDAFYRPLIEKEIDWVEENLVKTGKMTIVEDFAQTAPVYDPSMGVHTQDGPQEYTNQHTQGFCNLLQIPNLFHASDAERAQRLQDGPRADEWSGGRGRGRGGHRGGDRGRGRGRAKILEPSEQPTYTHPHLNVSLEDILAEEGRRRSDSQSSSSSGSTSPKSPTDEGKGRGLKRRGFTFGSKKGRRTS